MLLAGVVAAAVAAMVMISYDAGLTRGRSRLKSEVVWLCTAADSCVCACKPKSLPTRAVPTRTVEPR